jgi:ATPase subunit of ABC transporter with duplicated ATPase domains
VLDAVDLRVEAGARIGLVGSNGSGKSNPLRGSPPRLEPGTAAATSSTLAGLGDERADVHERLHRGVAGRRVAAHRAA